MCGRKKPRQFGIRNSPAATNFFDSPETRLNLGSATIWAPAPPATTIRSSGARQPMPLPKIS